MSAAVVGSMTNADATNADATLAPQTVLSHGNGTLDPIVYREALTFSDRKLPGEDSLEFEGIRAVSKTYLYGEGALEHLAIVYEAFITAVTLEEVVTVEQDIKLRVFLGMGWDRKAPDAQHALVNHEASYGERDTTTTVPAFFWSDGAEFLEFAYNIARIVICVDECGDDEVLDIEGIQAKICGDTQVLRRQLHSLGVFVGSLPLDFGPRSLHEAKEEDAPTAENYSLPLGVPVNHLQVFPGYDMSCNAAFWDACPTSSWSQAICDPILVPRILHIPDKYNTLCWWRASLPVRAKDTARWYATKITSNPCGNLMDFDHRAIVPKRPQSWDYMDEYLDNLWADVGEDGD